MTITPYNPQTDREEVERLLSSDCLKTFDQYNGAENVATFLSRQDGQLTGFAAVKKTSTFHVSVSVYVDPPHRRKGIGSLLLQTADQLLSDSPVEQAYCNFSADEGIAAFWAKNGYRPYCKSCDMERPNTLIDPEQFSDASLQTRGILIRQYEDGDYPDYHCVSDLAFYLLRMRLNLTPQYYQPLSETDRARLAKDADNRFVLLDKGVLSAIGALSPDTIHLLAVRPDLQGRGYGRILASWLNNLLITRRNAQTVKIGVLENNRAKALYESLGFQVVRRNWQQVKCYRPDSRPQTPVGYATEEEILRDLRLFGRLKEDFLT